jgi:hypothetical protein
MLDTQAKPNISGAAEMCYMSSPAGVIIKGTIKAIRRASGSKMPLFLRACHSAILSVKAPPEIDPAKWPISEGMLIRPLIAGLMLYGGAWKTDGLTLRAARKKPSEDAKTRKPNTVAGYSTKGRGLRSKRR